MNVATCWSTLSFSLQSGVAVVNEVLRGARERGTGSLVITHEPERIRPAAWVDGNLHAAELAGSSCALAIAEVGAVMGVGGNIDGVTRVMTTTIALETSKGDLPLALALGFILIVVVLAINAVAYALRGTFGEGLLVGPALNAWAAREIATRIQPALDVRELARQRQHPQRPQRDGLHLAYPLAREIRGDAHLVQRLAAFEVVEERLHRHPRADKHGRAPQDVRVRMNDRQRFHVSTLVRRHPLGKRIIPSAWQ